jgi:hypothetical protein
MPKFRLNISVEYDFSEEDAIQMSKDLISNCIEHWFPNHSKISLTRDGDRAGLNLLLPPLEGRMGSHYQGRKASIEEILNPKE